MLELDCVNRLSSASGKGMAARTRMLWHCNCCSVQSSFA